MYGTPSLLITLSVPSSIVAVSVGPQERSREESFIDLTNDTTTVLSTGSEQ